MSSRNYLAYSSLVIVICAILDSLILRMYYLMFNSRRPHIDLWNFFFGNFLSHPFPHQFQSPQTLQTLICLLNLARYYILLGILLMIWKCLQTKLHGNCMPHFSQRVPIYCPVFEDVCSKYLVQFSVFFPSVEMQA